jgi:hypothetical protein
MEKRYSVRDYCRRGNINIGFAPAEGFRIVEGSTLGLNGNSAVTWGVTPLCWLIISLLSWIVHNSRYRRPL